MLAGHCTWGSLVASITAAVTALQMPPLKSLLIQDLSVGLLTNMYKDKTDFTTIFRSLASVSADDDAGSIPPPLAKVCLSSARASQLCEA